MTGRDLIMYILKNHLEDELVFKDGKFIGCVTIGEAAAKMNVGQATISSLIKMGYMQGVEINGTMYVYLKDDASESIGGSDAKES